MTSSFCISAANPTAIATATAPQRSKRTQLASFIFALGTACTLQTALAQTLAPTTSPTTSTTAAAPREPEPQYPLAPPPPYVTPETPQGAGRYPALMEADAGLVTHTIYRPANLQTAGMGKLPIVVWGNGACLNVGNRFRYFLSEIASHGFLAIAIGPIGPKTAEGSSLSDGLRGNPAPKSPAALLKAQLTPGGAIPSDTTAEQLIDAIDWAIAENSRAGSKYQGKLDTKKIAVMGQSCGGLQAIDAAHDPRVTTLGVWNSGAFDNADRTWEIAAARAPKESLKTLHGTAIYITGAPTDVAFKNAEDDVSRIDGVPVFHAWRELTGHSGTYREPNGGAFGQVGVAWLQWQLKGDQQAARMFVGADCGLCTKAEWHVKTKKINPVAELKKP